MTTHAIRTKQYRTKSGTVTMRSLDGGKTWREWHREDLPPLPDHFAKPGACTDPSDRAEIHLPPIPTRCKHQAHGVCLVCGNAATLARRKARQG